MFKMLLSFLLVLSIGWADGKRDRSVVKKKVVMITSDDDQKNRSIEIEADVDDEILKLTITVNGDKKEFEVPLDNEEALEALQKELEEMDVDIHIADFMGHDDEEDHDFMRAMRWHGKGKSDGYLGVQIQGLDGQLADYFGAKDGGVLITEVIEDSPAEKAGMKAGDVILSVAGEEVEDASDLVEEIRGHKPDSQVQLNVIRKNRKRKMKVTLGEAPRSFSMGFSPGKNRMFFGDKDFDEDVDMFFNMDRNGPHKMMKRFRFHDEEFDLDELEDEMDALRKELRDIRKEIKKLKNDS